MTKYRLALVWLAPWLLAAAPAPAACHAPPGLSDIIDAAKRKFIVFGELHGTAQSPEMFRAAACYLAGKGERLLIAVELSSAADDRLQAVWSGPHTGFAERLITAMPEWKIRQDGVTSSAMLAMLQSLHRLKTDGAKIDVVAFNGARDAAQEKRWEALKAQGPHEAAQAENIRTAADARAYDHVLVLVGGFHARKAVARMGADEFEPMAMRLAPEAEVLALNMAYGAGTSWNCQVRGKPGKPVTSADIECAAHATRGNAEIAGSPRFGLGAPPGQEARGEWAGYDGHFWTGAVSASPPVVNEPGKEPR